MMFHNGIQLSNLVVETHDDSAVQNLIYEGKLRASSDNSAGPHTMLLEQPNFPHKALRVNACSISFP